MESSYRPMSVAERALMKSKLHYFYGRFIKVVAKGRNMKTEEVDKVGRGRVWSGEQGKPAGLVDEFGGLIDAVQYAKRMAGMAEGQDATLMILPKAESSLLSKLIGGGLARVHAAGAAQEYQALEILSMLIPGAKEVVHALPASLLAEPSVPQALLPYSLIFGD
jgi:ClpP class serine protease